MPKLKLALPSVILIPLLATAGCTSQTTIAALVSTLGGACASIATIENNPTLAQKIQADSNAASSAVLNWKSGTPAQDVIQAINLVESDLNLICTTIPAKQCTEYEPLIVLALSTAESIIAILNPSAAPKVRALSRIPGAGTIGGPPKNAKEYTQRWNALCAANPKLAKVAIH